MSKPEKHIQNTLSPEVPAGMVTVETNHLKQRLNSVFLLLRKNKSNAVLHGPNFDKLWDLKESAILEGKKIVELPGQWLHELEEIEQADEQTH